MESTPTEMHDEVRESGDCAAIVNQARIRFGRCDVDLTQRELRRDGQVIRLGGRAFDVLALILSSPGRVVTKAELLRTVWNGVVVEENNIQVQLYLLRKALGNDHECIVTVPGRGYMFAPHRTLQLRGSAPRDASSESPLLRCAPLIGRDGAIAQACAALPATQVLTLTGAGGVGKTALAMSIAHRIAEEGSLRVHAVELAALTSRDQLPDVIARACGLTAGESAREVEALRARLSGTDTLLFLDNAEHIVDDVAALVDHLTRGNPRLRVLVTSRERLRLGHESVFRVEPLAIPAADASASEILTQPAVQLFLSCVQAQGATDLDATTISLIGEICRRLDGVPLALELAAARVPSLGIAGVSRGLDNPLTMLTHGYRAALARHQTLRAAFDWSYCLLAPTSRKLFHRLALLGHVFTLETIEATACGTDLTFDAAIDAIGELVAKSIVNVEFDGPIARYRLTESTRAYALERLRDEWELPALWRPRSDMDADDAAIHSQCDASGYAGLRPSD
ncbi:ATP-binding protein [Paraburkholderia susongensis]|nr:winged helix-turn-helix domain-containing protein [Paraburkholderia susongensis]